MKNRLLLQVSFASLLALAMVGCGKSPPNDSNAAVASAQLPAGMLLTVPPAGAKEVAQAKQGLAVGDDVLVHGRIAGRKEPFVSGRAIFTLVDMSLPPCNARPEDTCPTPWDLCCEPRDKITDNSLSVRLVDAKGDVIRGELVGVGGLKPLAEVIVRARVASAGSGQWVLDARAVYVKPG